MLGKVIFATFRPGQADCFRAPVETLLVEMSSRQNFHGVARNEKFQANKALLIDASSKISDVELEFDYDTHMAFIYLFEHGLGEIKSPHTGEWLLMRNLKRSQWRSPIYAGFQYTDSEGRLVYSEATTHFCVLPTSSGLA